MTHLKTAGGFEQSLNHMLQGFDNMRNHSRKKWMHYYGISKHIIMSSLLKSFPASVHYFECVHSIPTAILFSQLFNFSYHFSCFIYNNLMFHYLHDNMPMTLVKQCGLEPLHLGLFSKLYDKQFEATEKKNNNILILLISYL